MDYPRIPHINIVFEITELRLINDLCFDYFPTIFNWKGRFSSND